MLVIHWASLLAQGTSESLIGTEMQQQRNHHARINACSWVLARAVASWQRSVCGDSLGKYWQGWALNSYSTKNIQYLGKYLRGDKWEEKNYQPRPRVFSAFKMAAQRRLWQTAGHVPPKLLEILIVWKCQRTLWLANIWSCVLLFARVSYMPPFWTPRRPWGRDWQVLFQIATFTYT